MALISEIAAQLTEHYRAFKKSNGGHKTSPKGKYGFKSIQYKVLAADGKEFGPFLGRGSALVAFRDKLAPEQKVGSKFVVEEIFIHKAKGKGKTIDGVALTLEVTARTKKVVD